MLLLGAVAPIFFLLMIIHLMRSGRKKILEDITGYVERLSWDFERYGFSKLFDVKFSHFNDFMFHKSKVGDCVNDFLRIFRRKVSTVRQVSARWLDLVAVVLTKLAFLHIFFLILAYVFLRDNPQFNLYLCFQVILLLLLFYVSILCFPKFSSQVTFLLAIDGQGCGLKDTGLENKLTELIKQEISSGVSFDESKISLIVENCERYEMNVLAELERIKGNIFLIELLGAFLMFVNFIYHY